MMATLRGAVFLAIPALAAAKLNACGALPGVETGVIGCAGSVLNTDCAVDLRIECDSMYPIENFSPSGIPCGAASFDACSDPAMMIAFMNPNYPLEALDAAEDEVRAILERGQNNAGDEDLFDTTEQRIEIPEDSFVNITFLFEGACDRNSLGFTSFSEDNPNIPGGDPRNINFQNRFDLVTEELDLTIIFPNLDFEFCQCSTSPSGYAEFCTESMPELSEGTTLPLIPDFRSDPTNLVFEAGTLLSLFVVPDGFDLGLMPGEVYNENLEQILFSTPELNDPDMVRKTPSLEDLRQHAFIFDGFDDVEVELEDGGTEIFDFSDELFVCFEDRRRFRAPPGKPPSNNDFEDVCVFLSIAPVIMDPTSAPSSMPSISVCADGILSECGNVCCAESCGTCGGCNCASQEGGAELCCPLTILFNEIPCLSATDVGCVANPFLICAEAGSNCPDR